LPINATAKVNATVNTIPGFLFQTFCLEPGVHIDFHVDLDWTASNTVQLVGGGTRNLDPRTAYLFWKFYTNQGFTPAYAYSPLGAARSASAADLQLAIWFTEGVSAFNGGNVGLYTSDAATAVAPGGGWAALWGTTFPGNLGGVKALNIVHNGALQQDLLAIFGASPPPPPDGDCEGRTPGFWHNKNGLKLIKESGAGADWSWLSVLNALPLVDKDGDDVDFTINKAGGDDLSDYLVSGNNAVNMAQKLSQHLAAMTLNILAGLADEDCLVYTGQNADCIDGSPETVEIGVVIQLAIDSLNADGYTPAGDDDRDYQECLKNILDAANNNTNWVN